MSIEGDLRLEEPAEGAPAAAAAAADDDDDFRLDPSASSAPQAPAAAAAAAPEPEAVEQVSFIGQHTDSALMQLDALERLVSTLSDSDGCPVCYEPMVCSCNLTCIFDMFFSCCFMSIVGVSVA